jgi:hypothetical protein
LFSVWLLSVALPSRKLTVPVAVEGVTVAVKVTDWPGTDGLRLDVRDTVVPDGPVGVVLAHRNWQSGSPARITKGK